jgi:hypothetical protein
MPDESYKLPEELQEEILHILLEDMRERPEDCVNLCKGSK